jgi:cell division initiation protein
MNSSEIKLQQFKKVLRGFDPREVSTFLSQLASEMESLQTENANLKTSLNEAVKELEHYHSIEQSIQQTLIQAQESSNKFVSNAKQFEAESRREAEVQASHIIEEAHKEKIHLQEELLILQTKQKNIVENLKSLLTTELENLNRTEYMLNTTSDNGISTEEQQKHSKEIEEIVNVLVG